MIELDEEDAAFVAKAQEGLLGKSQPYIGDVVLFPDGHMERIMHRVLNGANWSGCVQLDGGDVNGSYHLMFGGGVSYSGAGGNVYDMDKLERTAEVEKVKFWVAHHESYYGGCARECECDVNVWEIN
jgi:hypothetical protein